MSAASALQAARDAGIGLHVDGVDLVLEASAPPSAAILDSLARHKADLIILLQPGNNGWSDEDWRALYDERVGIAEFDGGLPRPEAEALAFEFCVVEWLNRTFERSPAESCLACGGGDRAHDALLPHGVDPTGHVWLHSRCWPSWQAGRRVDAVIALKAMGIEDRSKGT
ncbi:hypothetical protein [Pyruvatibacter sp.]|uniref:hypothetical protein n=1 Tax=Pyruvatibacter sp. TaxID=1981328 RepID=UPI0032F05FFD